MTTFSYSIDEEHFIGKFISVEEAAETGFDDNPDYDSLWIGTNRLLTAHYFVCVRNFLDDVANAASDECGEAAEDWLSELMENKDKREELRKLIGDWIEVNDPVKFWTVDDVIEVKREVLK